MHRFFRISHLGQELYEGVHTIKMAILFFRGFKKYHSDIKMSLLNISLRFRCNTETMSWPVKFNSKVNVNDFMYGSIVHNMLTNHFNEIYSHDNTLADADIDTPN